MRGCSSSGKYGHTKSCTAIHAKAPAPGKSELQAATGSYIQSTLSVLTSRPMQQLRLLGDQGDQGSRKFRGIRSRVSGLPNPTCIRAGPLQEILGLTVIPEPEKLRPCRLRSLGPRVLSLCLILILECIGFEAARDCQGEAGLRPTVRGFGIKLCLHSDKLRSVRCVVALTCRVVLVIKV